MKRLRTLSRPLAVAAAAFVMLLAAGLALIWTARQTLAQEHRKLASAQADRRHVAERLLRIAHEEREVRDHVELYQRLKDLRILGEERRLEWVEALTRIRAEHELLDLRYQVERQKVLKTLPGSPAGLDLRSSSMTVELALLHEGDLLRFLGDLRASGNAYYSVRHCTITRVGAAPSIASIAPRLRGNCQIDLITLSEGKAGT
ncbi:MAG TPA: hypothetical protein VGP71_01295 [Burkholderiales bacterium]|jgi:hypothetical protein|nr:hypothetical protein [Burkholderiales bacterium]